MEVETLIESGYCYSSNDLISVPFNNASAKTAITAPISQVSCDRMDPLCRQRHLSGYRTLILKLTLTLTLF